MTKSHSNDFLCKIITVTVNVEGNLGNFSTPGKV